MNRSKRIILLCHCLINTNSKVWGYATYGDMLKPLVQVLLDQKTGIFQLPCPEHTFLGISRLGKSKEQYDTPSYREHCETILATVIDSIKDYLDNGYIIAGVIGIKGSPSCGVYHTYSDKEKGGDNAQGRGVFIEVLQNLLIQHDVELTFVELDEENVISGLKQVKELLEK